MNLKRLVLSGSRGDNVCFVLVAPMGSHIQLRLVVDAAGRVGVLSESTYHGNDMGVQRKRIMNGSYPGWQWCILSTNTTAYWRHQKP